MGFLVGVDGSESSDNAVAHAVGDASKWGADIEIVHVLTPETKIVDGHIVLPGEQEAIEYSKRTLDRAKHRAIDVLGDYSAEIEITTTLLTGRPANAIAAHAKEKEMQRIYVGHRGLSDDYDQVGGSVAKGIVDKATVPVTIVK